MAEYTCPMHPEIVQPNPGLCPKCGMTLILKKGRKESSHEDMIHDYQKRFWFSFIITLPILLLSPMIKDILPFRKALTFSGDLHLLFALSSIVFFYGGWPFLKGLYQEIRAKSPGMMTLIGLAISVAYIYSSFVIFGLTGKPFFWELSTLIDIMLLGHWIEMKSVLGAGKALEELVRLLPSIAHKVMSDGSIKDISLEELTIEDRVLVRPGEKIPADGVVLEGDSSVNEALLTGESAPVRKEKNSQVIGGSINAEGSLTIAIKKMGKDSFLSQVIEMVKTAQESKSKTQDLANRAALWLTIIAIGGGFLTFSIWVLFTSQNVGFALERTVTVMVIACPHALGLAVPLVVAVSTALAAQRGLLIRNRAAFESARNIQAVVFDKTGTLTLGEFGVTDIISFSQENEEEILNLAGSIEIHSEHPIAKAITKRSHEKWPVEAFKAIPGVGAEGKVKGKNVKVVSPAYIKEILSDPRIATLSEQGKTVVFVLIENKPIGAIALADMIRKESKEAIAKLKKMNIQCMMLTGDNKLVGKWVAAEIQLDDFFAEVLPNQKVEKIKEVQSRRLIVAMVGDGVNDAPALAQADVGIAIGAGTNIAIESADIILVKSDLLDVVGIIALARKTYGKMVQNLLWATGYNAIAIPLAAGVLYSFGVVLTPALGAVFMSLSTIICAINAKLLKVK
ncbi:MAG TPA: copper-translocating P-type ATPase [Chlamydiales bacterium]|nr:copper-translocating P-type ATPase [Chlamydiales bacterium]